jgi:hypothetical protein
MTTNIKNVIDNLIEEFNAPNEPESVVVEKVIDSLSENNLLESDEDKYLATVEAYIRQQLISSEETDNELAELERQDVASKLINSLRVVEMELDDEDDIEQDEDGDDDFRNAEEDEWRSDFRGRGFSSKFQMEDEENFDMAFDAEDDF